MIERGDHVWTHIVPRLDLVIAGEDGSGITSAENWTGGGSYKVFSYKYRDDTTQPKRCNMFDPNDPNSPDEVEGEEEVELPDEDLERVKTSDKYIGVK